MEQVFSKLFFFKVSSTLCHVVSTLSHTAAVMYRKNSNIFSGIMHLLAKDSLFPKSPALSSIGAPF